VQSRPKSYRRSTVLTTIPKLLLRASDAKTNVTMCALQILVTSYQGFPSSVICEALKCNIPHLEAIRAIMRLAWACAGGNMQLIINNAGCEMLHANLRENEPDGNDVQGK
jgi:hypothetical protein